MDKRVKATVTILVHELQACGDMSQVRDILDSWIKANDLHPERVGTFVSLEELRKYIKKEETDG